MLIKRIISTLLVAIMLLSSILAISVSAEGEDAAKVEYEFDTDRDKPVSKDFYLDGKHSGQVIDTPEKRLELMDLRLVKGDLSLYVDAYSGEVAVKNTKTGQIIFTNPYDASSQKIPDNNKKKLLSQLEISYTPLKSNTSATPYNTFNDCVLAGQTEVGEVPSQIVVRYIPDGIRVEYSIGRIDSRMLVPIVMTDEAYQELIWNVAVANGATKTEQSQLKAYFTELALEKPAEGKELSEAAQKRNEDRLKEYPMLQKEVDGETVDVTLRILDKKAGRTQKKYLENLIRKYCPDFTYEVLDNHYREIGYESKEEPMPLFKVALEYTLEADGFSVRLPANGIRFDESAFRLENIKILPYLGAASLNNEGYIFYPDGAGSLITFEDLNANATGGPPKTDIYDEDFGKSQLSQGHRHYEKIRYPVFGMRETVVSNETGEATTNGFVAIIEEGDAMSGIEAKSEKISGVSYAICHTNTNPRPYDTIKLSGAESAWNVVSERKYTGNYRIRYIMLSGEDATYVGMAEAYRQYLIDEGVLTAIKEEEVKEDVPLYIESFGSIETTKRFLSIPYKTNVALTSFQNIKDMYAELLERGVSNVNFILTGFAKGGLTNATIPYDINWDSSVEDDLKFDELLADAEEKGYGVFPDFDFAFTSNDEWFDGLSLREHAVKTIDGRYTAKREYSATRQTQINYYELAISPSFFSHFYEHLTEDYDEYGPQGISVSSLGMYLYSDFDEDDPYNREDSKQFIVDSLKYFKETKEYSKVITSGGNAYTWKYADVITDIAVDSSSYKYASATVPFLGIVLHGYVETVTTPINMEGNVDYAILRAIENGAALKFMLSYDNTELLKEQYSTSAHYSIRYDIWLNDLILYYQNINTALGDLQTATIVDHRFITGDNFISGVRVPDGDELYFDAEASLDDLIEAERIDSDNELEANRILLQSVRTKLMQYRDLIAGKWNDSYEDDKKALDDAIVALSTAAADKKAKEEALNAATKAFEDMKTAITNKEPGVSSADLKPLTEAKNAADTEFKAAETAYNKALEEFTPIYEAYVSSANARMTALGCVESDAAFFAENFELLKQSGAYNETIIAELETLLDSFNSSKDTLVAGATALDAEIKAYNDKIVAICPDYFGVEEDGDAEGEGAEGEAEPTVTEPTPVTEGETAEEDAEAGDLTDEGDIYEYSKYDVSDTTIVYEKYSNGTEFILNFNNFDVKVTLNGKAYLVAAYGYVII